MRVGMTQKQLHHTKATSTLMGTQESCPLQLSAQLDCLSLSSLHVGLVRDLPPPQHPEVFILSCWSQSLSIIEVSVLPDM